MTSSTTTTHAGKFRLRIARAVLLALGTGLAVLLGSAQSSAEAEAISGHAQIAQAVYNFLDSFYDPQHAGSAAAVRAEIDVANLDPRLQIQACSTPLTTRLNQQQQPLGRVTVRVECHDDSPWTRYIQANVRVFQPIVFTTRALPRGARLSAADVELQETDISTLRSTVLYEPSAAIGQELRRAVPAGTALSAETLAAPVLVARGDTVVITAQRGPVSIRQQGVALQNGEKGRQINIRNSSSNRVIQAVVTGPGEVAVVF